MGRNHRIRVEAKIGSSRGKAALIFGYRSSGDFHLIEVAHQGKRFILRTPTTGFAGKLFQAARIALPPNIREAEPASDAVPA